MNSTTIFKDVDDEEQFGITTWCRHVSGSRVVDVVIMFMVLMLLLGLRTGDEEADDCEECMDGVESGGSNGLADEEDADTVVDALLPMLFVGVRQEGEEWRRRGLI